MKNIDEWKKDGNTLDQEKLRKIKEVIEETPLIMEHWFYKADRSPERLVFEEYDLLLEYLTKNARPGDAIHIWRFDQSCRDDNTLTHGKVPDEYGRIPTGGAY